MSARVALVGAGQVGRLLVPRLHERGHRIVAAIGRGAAVGQDIGELAGGTPSASPSATTSTPPSPTPGRTWS
ncbi:hypothetical protein [Leucobacter soli]|uniref:hypothetical protein n=1 Tax=Leucobacter soli TaxID=2812850 RepID=UPI00360D0A1D